eukprot:gb/GECG01010090.1/.p1 GENE.gb/GECG01010090.1/~~gb/GECG01010090.1/.p1  ORF type:complete len:933 (+),score=237.48 gb/GECG01010090.1/:1-2799(+)
MAKKRGKQRPIRRPKQTQDVYSDDENESVESFEADEGAPADGQGRQEEDEEIDEDAAFNSEDEALYGDVFKKQKGGSHRQQMDNDSSSDASGGDSEDEDDDEVEPEGDTILDMLDAHIASTEKARKRRQNHQQMEEDYDDDDNNDDNEANRRQLLASLGYSHEENQKGQQEEGGKRNNYFLSVRDEAVPENEFNVAAGSEMGESNEGQGLSINSLLSSLKDKGNYSELKKKLEGLSKGEAALKERPSNAVEERATRRAAYNYTSQEVSRWQGIVRANRNAPHLSYTHENRKALPNEIKSPLTSAALAGKFQAETGMEQEVAAALSSAGMEHEGAVVQDETHELEERTVSKEDLRQRQKQLAKLKALMFYDEKKRQRANRIKSKGYRKMKKRQRLRDAEKERERLKKADPEAARRLEEEEALAKATERMTQKKQNASHMARKTLAISSGTSGRPSKEEAEEELLREKELRDRINGGDQQNSADDDSEGSESDDNDIAKLKKMRRKILRDAGLDEQGNVVERQKNGGEEGLAGLKFMQKARERQQNQIQEEALQQAEEFDRKIRHAKGGSASDDESDDDTSGNIQQSRRSFHGGIDTYPVASASNDVNGKHSGPARRSPASGDRSHRAKTTGVMTVDIGSNDSHVQSPPLQMDQISSNPWMDSSLQSNSSRAKSGKQRTGVRSERVGTEVEESASTEKLQLNVQTGIQRLNQLDQQRQQGKRKTNQENKDRPGQKRGRATEQEELIRRAFAVAPEYDEAELDKEKRETTEANKEEVGDSNKGWGEWTGMGINKFPEGVPIPKGKKRRIKRDQKQKEKQKEEKIREELKGRKDSKLSNVYISEKRDRKLAEHQVDKTPYPFSSKEHYERALQTPLGKEWNTLSAVQDLNRPEDVSRAGEVIEPVKYVNIKKRQQGRPKGTTPTMGKTGNLLGVSR